MEVFVITLFCLTVIFFVGMKISFHKKWSLVRTTFGFESYSKLTAILNQSGIPYRTRTPIGSIKPHLFPIKDQTQYDIYVKNLDEHKAHEALRGVK